MYKQELIARVARETRMSKRDVADALNGVLSAIQDVLRHGNTVTIPGFGTFYTRQKTGGMVKHIRTGKPVKYEARRVAAFRVGQVLSRAVKGRRR